MKSSELYPRARAATIRFAIDPPSCASALAATIEMSEGEAARKKEKLQELVQQKERARHQAGEIITSKAVREQSNHRSVTRA